MKQHDSDDSPVTALIFQEKRYIKHNYYYHLLAGVQTTRESDTAVEGEEEELKHIQGTWCIMFTVTIRPTSTNS